MEIKAIFLNNFRKFESKEMFFSKGLNVIYGENASGKTTFIEAISLSSLFRSFRTKEFDAFPLFNSDYFLLKTQLFDDENELHEVCISQKNRKNAIIFDGNKVKKASDFIGLFPSVSLSQTDFLIFKNGPQARRDFFDVIFCQISKKYVDAVNYFRTLLKDRNALLKRLYFESANELLELLDVYDEKLISVGLEIISYRKKYVDDLNDILKEYFVSEKKFLFEEEIKIEYAPFTGVDEFATRLKEHRNVDIQVGHTTIGPHKDDYIFIINNKNVEQFGSQGQQRSALFETKFAQAALIERQTKRRPVVLLDDIFGDLDKKRINLVIDFLYDKYQSFITTTTLNDIDDENFKKISLIKVTKEGEIEYGKQ